MQNIWEEIGHLQKSGERGALATIVGTKGSTPRKAGAKMLVLPGGKTLGTIGGGCLEAEVYEEARQVIKTGRPRLVSYDLSEKEASDLGLVCGGTMDVFVEPVGADPSLLIFGAGHVAHPLAQVGKLLGFRVTVLDDREYFANPQRFPEADRTVVGEFKALAEEATLGPSTYVVIVTRGHEHDREVLASLINKPLAYLGMIGSRAKVDKVFRILREDGVPQEVLRRVHAPIGLDIGAESPEEVAVAIMAEILAVKNGRSAGLLSKTATKGA